MPSSAQRAASTTSSSTRAAIARGVQLSLDALAKQSARRASSSGARVALEPMTAVERKIVHEALKDDPEVETMSEGTEPNRYVVVLPRHFAD